jgi:predicted PurR-regulated permease PerM
MNEQESNNRFRFGNVTGEIWRTNMTFVRSRIIVCLLVGLLTGIGYWLVGLPYWWAWAVVIGATNAVPMLPLICGLLPSVIQGYVHFGDLAHPFYLTLVFMIVQMLDGFVLSPLIQGKMVGLHPVTTLILLTAGSLIFGFFGLILAIPIAIALKIIFREFFKPKTVHRVGGMKHIEVEDVTQEKNKDGL